jgi:carboxyl-terminal processing protease
MSNVQIAADPNPVTPEQERKARKAHSMLIGIFVGVLIFFVGFKIGQLQPAEKRDSIAQTLQQLDPSIARSKGFDSALYNQVISELNTKYVDKSKLDAKKQFYGALKGIVASVGDPYTFFLTPDENKQSKDDLGGRFEGIGAQLGLKNNAIVIIAPLKNSPAAQAGIRSGDYIIKVDGADTKGWTLAQAVGKIRGVGGTDVKLTLFREPKNEFDVKITRATIQVDSVETTYESKNGKNVAVIKVNQFGETTNEEWDKAVDAVSAKYKSGEVQALAVDMRGNPGGFLDSAVYLAGEFLPRGKLVVKQESTTAGNRNYTVDRDGRLLDIPLVVLIDQGSASAAEIFSGAMRDHARAQLVGEKSFGKGSVQEAEDLKDNAGLHVTIAKWILPKGDWIHGKGIVPSIKVDNEVKDGNTLQRSDDAQLDRALDVVTK